MFFPTFRLEGTPRSRGHQYARAAAERIALSIALYRRRFAEVGLSWTRALAVAREWFYEPVARQFPEGLEEMKGIAEAADLPVEAILALNARYELLRVRAECTSVALLAEATGGPILLAQNWDFHPSVIETGVVLDVRPVHGPRQLVLAEAGQLGRNGLGSNGRAVVANSLAARDDAAGPGLPVSLLRRMFLSAATWEDGLEAIVRGPRAVSNNVLVAESRDRRLAKSGRALDLELAPGGAHVLGPRHGRIVHANHFVAPGHPEERSHGTGSSDRHRRLESLLCEGRVDEDRLVEALADHLGEPICRHGGRNVTAACVVMNVTDGAYAVCCGPPCRGRFVRHHL